MRKKRIPKAIVPLESPAPVADTPVESEPSEPTVISMPMPKKPIVYQEQEPLEMAIGKACTKRILEARAEMLLHEAAIAQSKAELERLQANIHEYVLMTLEDHDVVCEGALSVSEDAMALTMQRRLRLVQDAGGII
jgi:hypothetical protein